MQGRTVLKIISKWSQSNVGFVLINMKNNQKLTFHVAH